MDEYSFVRKPTPCPKHTELVEAGRRRRSKLSAPLSVGGKKPSSAAITKHLLNTISDSSNPITYSNIYDRSDTVVSTATGHQRGEGRTTRGVSAKAHFEDRSRKLSLQGREKIREGILGKVRVYIDGYLSGTTDIEMKRVIAQAGGTTLSVPSGATHIVTSQQLIGPKTHRILRSRNLIHVVKPEWVTDSIVAGQRLPESHYALIRSSSTRNLVDMLMSGRSS